ncbi:MAG: hypothetical protein Q3996_00995 [Candidatus Saccharibacteria bacterium]|nr:hypothetical protein [Candidatus Saccharibacteria bacterium]
MGGNKSTVLIIGQNIERQIVEFGENEILRDERDRAWLDIKFDNYFLRSDRIEREFSQLTHLERTLQLLDFQTQMSTLAHNFAIRVVLKVGDDRKIIRTKDFDDQLWSEPEFEPSVIALLDSANLSLDALSSLLQYLKSHPAVKFVIEYRNDLLKNEVGRQLLRQATLVWADLRSRQTAETDNLIEKFKFFNQILLINHQTGLSLSDKQRTYKLNSAEYINLNSLEWLAIAIKVLQYRFDLDDMLITIGQIGSTIMRQNQPSVDEFKNSCKSFNVELIRGEPNNEKILSRISKEITSEGLILDLSTEKLPVIREILQVHGLEKTVASVILGLKHFEELMKHDVRMMTKLQNNVKVGVEIPSQKRSLVNRPKEMVDMIGNDVEFLLDQTKFYRLPVAKFVTNFLLGRDLPSDAVLFANVRQMALFSAQSKKRQIAPLLKIRGLLQTNFEQKQGALSLEFARILRCLMVEFRNFDLKFEQVIINLEIVNPSGKKWLVDDFVDQCKLIGDYLYDHGINCPHLLFSGELGQKQFIAAYQQQKLICNSDSLDQLTLVPRENNQLRIKFSQFLAELDSK